MIGDRYARVFCLDNLPTFMNAEILSDLSGIPCNMMISCTIRAVPSKEASMLVKGQISGINANIMKAQKQAAKSGYSGDLLPSELQRAQEQAKALKDDMVSRNQKLFFVTILITLFAETKEELDEESQTLASLAVGHLVDVKVMNYQQESAFNTCLPLGEIGRASCRERV